MKQRSPHKEERATELIKQLIAEYISRESNRQSLITVTSVSLSDRFDTAIVSFTVLPESYEETVLTFLKRQAQDIRGYIREHARIHTIPFLTFVIDKGEKNRQRIDELSINKD